MEEIEKAVPAARARTASVAAARARWLTPRRKEAIAGVLFLSPWLVGATLLWVRPFFMSIVYALSDYNLLQPPMKFVGLQNFIDIFTSDAKTLPSLIQTFKYALLNVPITMAASLVIAMLLNTKRLIGISFWRTVYFLPAVVPDVAMWQLWRLIFNERGLLNHVLGWFGVGPVLWLQDPRVVLFAFVFMNMFNAGAGILLWIGALQGVPTSLYESAELDGASKWRQLWSITLPMISPIILFSLVTRIGGNLAAFGNAYVMTSNPNEGVYGEPQGATYFFMLHIYLTAFNEFRMGYASALSWLLFVIGVALTGLVFRWSRAWVYYENMFAIKGR